MAVAMMKKTIRLDKYLTEMGKGSRTQIKDAAKKGRVLVNGIPEKKTDRKIDPDTDQVLFDGEPVAYQAFEYYMMNKPQGVISATEDPRHRTVIDLLGSGCRKDLFPVGRLDIDTEGLLLLTNDGDLAHRLLAPKKHVDKVYFAVVAGTLPDNSAELMHSGITLKDGTKVRPAKLEILCRRAVTKDELAEACKESPLLDALPQQTELSETRLTIHEGKFHQVKRMFEALDCRVLFLKRLSMGSLLLDEALAPGQFRPLTEEELSRLKAESTFHPETARQPDPAAAQKPAAGSGPESDSSAAPQPDTSAPPAVSSAGSVIRRLLKQKKAVIFDLDGTLVDSMWMWHQIDIEYLGRYGYQCPPDLQRKIEGMSFSETAVYFKEQFRIPDSLDQIKQAWIDMSIEKYRCQVPLKKGAGQFLEYLKASGIRMGIATSNGRDMVDAVLNSLKIGSYFQVITTACEVAAGKPAPDIYLKVAKDLSAAPEECMVFEDVPAGIMAGKAAGMVVCAVEDSYSAGMRAEKTELADYFIEDYEELFL